MPSDLTTQLQDIERLLCLLEYFKTPPPKPKPPPRNWELWGRAVTEVGATYRRVPLPYRGIETMRRRETFGVYDGTVTSAGDVTDYTLNDRSVVDPVYRRLDPEYDKADKEAQAQYAREFAANGQEADHLFVCIKATIQRFTELPSHKALTTYSKAIESLTWTTIGLSWVIRDLKRIKAKIEFHISRGTRPMTSEELCRRLRQIVSRQPVPLTRTPAPPPAPTRPPAPAVKAAEIEHKPAGEKTETVEPRASAGVADKGGTSEHDDEQNGDYYQDEKAVLNALQWERSTLHSRLSEARKDPNHSFRALVEFEEDGRTVKGYRKSGVLEYRAGKYGSPTKMQDDEAFGKSSGNKRDEDDADASTAMHKVIPGRHPPPM